VRELAEAAGLIENAGFTFYDDIVHGYGGGLVLDPSWYEIDDHRHEPL
jgi:hypothetical protein